MLTGALVADLRRTLARWRWLLASGLAAGAVATGLPALAPPAPASTDVWAAAHDLAAGTALSPGDVTRMALPRRAVPDGALTTGAAVTGRTVAGRVRRGESLTDARLVGPGLLPPSDGSAPTLVAVPVRLADAGVAALLQVGGRVDVLAAPGAPDGSPDASPTGGPAGVVSAGVVAADALVLAVPAPASGAADGALVLLAASPATAGRLASAGATSRLSVVLLG